MTRNYCGMDFGTSNSTFAVSGGNAPAPSAPSAGAPAAQLSVPQGPTVQVTRGKITTTETVGKTGSTR